MDRGITAKTKGSSEIQPLLVVSLVTEALSKLTDLQITCRLHLQLRSRHARTSLKRAIPLDNQLRGALLHNSRAIATGKKETQAPG